MRNLNNLLSKKKSDPNINTAGNLVEHVQNFLTEGEHLDEQYPQGDQRLNHAPTQTLPAEE